MGGNYCVGSFLSGHERVMIAAFTLSGKTAWKLSGIFCHHYGGKVCHTSDLMILICQAGQIDS